MSKKNDTTRYTPVTLGGRIRDKIVDSLVPIFITFIITTISTVVLSFFTFTRLSANALATVYANSERITTIESELKTEYVLRDEEILRHQALEKQLFDLQLHMDQRFDDLFQVLRK